MLFQKINIGLEIHLQLNTTTKAFCKCSTNYNNTPNSNICPICLGHPGTLPLLNKEIIKAAVQLGIKCNCKINKNFIFARKSYFYPDLSKGYQITQSDTPICSDGFINLKSGKKINIQRIHIEEDAGKSIHDDNNSLIDYNRCGIALLEIVSAPDLTEIDEAIEYFQYIHSLVTDLNICTGNMEEGAVRCDANISISQNNELGQRTEIKNLNSFTNLKNALIAELDRQKELLNNNQKIEYQTLTFDVLNKTIIPLRSKEFAHDYRYFPEPDLVKYQLTDEQILQYKKEIPILSFEKIQFLIDKFKLTKYQAEIIVNRKLYDIFEKFVLLNSNKEYIDLLVNFLINGVLSFITTQKINPSILDQNTTNILIKYLDKLVLNRTIININAAKNQFIQLFFNQKTEPNFDEIIIRNNNEEIKEFFGIFKEQYPKEILRYKNGEDKLMSFLIGKLIQSSNKKIDPIVAKQQIENLKNEI